MLNGLNTGGFRLHNKDAATEITNRVLSMLSNYLISNSELRLNETFKVYVKVLSIEHMEEHKRNPPRYIFLY